MSEKSYPSTDRNFRLVSADESAVRDAETLSDGAKNDGAALRRRSKQGNPAWRLEFEMKRTDQCAVVIPCFNESRRLNVQAFADFANSCQGVEFVFVNDGSTDPTLDRIAEIYQHAPQATNTLSLYRNSGKGEAVRTGLIWAATRGFDTVGFWDADLATPLETIHGYRRVLAKFPGVDVVWGTRLNLLGRQIERNFIRRQIGRGFSTASALAVGVGIRDALCGAKMFRNGDLLRHIVSKTYSSRWIFDVEMLARMRWLCRNQERTPLVQSLYEYPLDQWFEIAGSKLRTADFVKATRELTHLFVKYRLLSARLKHQTLSGTDQHSGILDPPVSHEVIAEAKKPYVGAQKAA